MAQAAAPRDPNDAVPGVLHDPDGLPTDIGSLARYVSRKGCFFLFEHSGHEVILTLIAPQGWKFKSKNQERVLVMTLEYQFDEECERGMINGILQHLAAGLVPVSKLQRGA